MKKRYELCKQLSRVSEIRNRMKFENQITKLEEKNIDYHLKLRVILMNYLMSLQ